MKATKIIYWTTTGLIFAFEGVLVALTSHTELAREGISHLGYPLYFGILLSVLKVAGALALIFPFVPTRIKEWAYAGFTFTMFSAFVSHWMIDGFGVQTIFPLLFLGVLAMSYLTFHKLKAVRVHAS